VVEDLVGELLSDDRRQKIMEDAPLVVPAHLLLHGVKRLALHQVGHAVVEAEQVRLQLTYDDVLVIARIADQCARRFFDAVLLVRDVAGQSDGILI